VSAFFHVGESEGALTLVLDEAQLALFPHDALMVVPTRYCAFEITGALGAAAVGVIHSVSQPLFECGVSIVYISAFDTDVVLVCVVYRHPTP
jgi:hypothetical protein